MKEIINFLRAAGFDLTVDKDLDSKFSYGAALYKNNGDLSLHLLAKPNKYLSMGISHKMLNREVIPSSKITTFSELKYFLERSVLIEEYFPEILTLLQQSPSQSSE